ncbi:MAG: hypothetical protein EOP45_10665, partial [Sphingobacteriaceae bacterium]
MTTLSFFGSILLSINLNNPFIKVLLPLAGIAVVVLLCKYKYHYSLTNDLKLRTPPLNLLLIWVVIEVVWMATTDYLLNWRGKFDFTPWIHQPLYVSVLRV